MANKYNENRMIAHEIVSAGMVPSAETSSSVAWIRNSIDTQNILLAQISESLAILANNTRLIQEKESK